MEIAALLDKVDPPPSSGAAPAVPVTPTAPIAPASSPSSDSAASPSPLASPAPDAPPPSVPVVPKIPPRELVERAYYYALRAHEGQKRVSGEPYITHLVEVAGILADFHMDATVVAAGLLHDVLEDTPVTYEQVEAQFGADIAGMVEGVTKISTKQFQDGQIRQAESMRKTLVAMAKDVRVILIKLADRLHNMRTLEYLSEERQKKLAVETLDLFAPLAHRLGMSKVRSELEDLSLRHLDPVAYREIAEKVALKRKEREELIQEVKEALEKRLKETGIPGSVQGRSKHFYSIWRKMKSQQKDIEEIFDLTAVRILTHTVKNCYEALGLVHTLWKPIPGRFKDYIAMPKNNLYQSLHTTVLGPHAHPVEIQIRSYEMHRVAEEGIASHWAYKEGRAIGKEDAKFAWIRQLLDLQQDIRENTEESGSFKVDVFEDEVFAFTPRGDVKELAKGSTALDFAYAVHTDVGNHTLGVKVNGQMVPLKYVMKSGDIVEVITQANRSPSRDWLKIATSSRAKNKIRHWFRTHLTAEEIERGRLSMDKEARRMGVDWHATVKTGQLQEIAGQFNSHTVDELLADIGHGEVSPRAVLNRLLPKAAPAPSIPVAAPRPPRPAHERKTASPAKGGGGTEGISISGQGDLMVKFARCCTPVPGDPIVGYITRGRGVSVHRADCPNTADLANQEDRIVHVSWSGSVGKVFEAALQVRARNRERLLADLLHVLSSEGVPITETSARVLAGGLAEGYFVVQINDSEQLRKILSKLKQVPDVIDAQRTEPK
jgi:GTP pyrophosphokinase